MNYLDENGNANALANTNWGMPPQNLEEWE